MALQQIHITCEITIITLPSILYYSYYRICNIKIQFIPSNKNVCIEIRQKSKLCVKVPQKMNTRTRSLFLVDSKLTESSIPGSQQVYFHQILHLRQEMITSSTCRATRVLHVIMTLLALSCLISALFYTPALVQGQGTMLIYFAALYKNSNQ